MSDVVRLIETVNLERSRFATSRERRAVGVSEAERRLDDLFGVSQRLAVYGTLAPGRSNHHVVAHLDGEWTDALVEGYLFPYGWGPTLGYPAFHPRTGGDAVAIHLLTSRMLPSAWPAIDRFEGRGYDRVLVPVFSRDGVSAERLYTVANLYAVAGYRDDEPDSHRGTQSQPGSL